ncbi:MAG: hypothetical protein ACRD0H_04295 [Actinomycetes bacterium]
MPAPHPVEFRRHAVELARQRSKVQLPGGYTVRWRRGDPAAHVLSGERTDDHGMAGVVGTIAMSPSGWTDLAEVR